MTANAAERTVLLRELNRYRARLKTIASVRAAAVTGLALLALVIVAAGLTPLGARIGVAAAAAIVALGTAAAAAISAARAPDLMATARIADVAVRGNDAVVTALECFRLRPTGYGATVGADPVGDLIVRQAVERVTRVTSHEALPLELPRICIPLAGACAVLLIAAMAVPSSVREWPGEESSTRAAIDSSGDAAASRGARRTSTTQPSATGAITSRAVMGAATPQEVARTERGGASQRSPEPLAGARREGTTATSDAKTGGAPSPRDLEPTRQDRRGDPSAGANSGTASRGSADAARSGVAAAGTSNAGAGAGSSGLSSKASAGAGGAGAASPVTPGSASRAAASSEPASANVPEQIAAWKRAQAAIAREQVPGRYRQLIRGYFAAIPPPQPRQPGQPGQQ